MTLPFFDPRLIGETENENQALPPAEVAKVAKVHGIRGVSAAKVETGVANVEPDLADFSRNLSGEIPEKSAILADLATLAAPALENCILSAIPTLLTGRPVHELTAAKQAVMAFLENHLDAARRIGWSDLELFGCHRDRGAARNRFDYAGAVTLAAISGHSIERITERAAHYENRLAYFRRPMPADAVSVRDLA